MQTTSAKKVQQDHDRESLSALDQFRREAQRIPPLQEAEELDLVRQVRYGVRSARDRLVEAYQIHLLRLARRYAPRCASLMLLDLVQEGNLGLLAALERVDKWDGERSFRHWALGWAQKRMTRAAWSNDGLVQISDYSARRVKTDAQTASAEAMGAFGAPTSTARQQTPPAHREPRGAPGSHRSAGGKNGWMGGRALIQCPQWYPGSALSCITESLRC